MWCTKCMLCPLRILQTLLDTALGLLRRGPWCERTYSSVPRRFHFFHRRDGTLGVYILWGMACQGVLVGMGDPEKISWRFPKVFPLLAPGGHWHLPVLGTKGWFPLPLPTLLLAGSYLGCPQGGIVPDLLRFALFEEANLLLQILQHCSHSSHGVQLLPCVPLLWHNLLLCQGHLGSLSGGHFIFSHGLRGRGWHISNFVVPWTWRHALRRDCFFAFLYLVPSGVAKMWKCFFFFFL